MLTKWLLLILFFENRKNLWIHRLELPKENVHHNSKVCSAHFSHCDYLNHNRLRLKKTAVPRSIHPQSNRSSSVSNPRNESKPLPLTPLVSASCLLLIIIVTSVVTLSGLYRRFKMEIKGLGIISGKMQTIAGRVHHQPRSLHQSKQASLNHHCVSLDR